MSSTSKVSIKCPFRIKLFLTSLQSIKCESLEPLIEFSSSDSEGIQIVVETNCYTSEWHIVRILHKSKKWCHTIQKHTQAKYKLLVVRHGKPIAAPTCKGQKCKYKGTTIEIEEFWFCLDQILRCVMGPKHSHVLTQPEILEVWHVLTDTNLTHTEVIELEEAGLCLQSNVPISPRRLLTPSLWNDKHVCRSCKAPTENHRN